MLDQNGMGDQEIHEVAESGNFIDLKSLIDSDIKLVDANGWFGTKPLHYASRSGNLECVKYLVEHGADVNAKGIVNKTTPIFEASTDEVAKFLHTNGASLDVISDSGRVPLDYAIQGKHVEVVNYLVKSGVDVNFIKTPNFYHTMLQWAINEIILNDEKIGNKADIDKSFSIVEILLNAGANPNQRNVYGTTVLHLAVSKKLKNFVSLLLIHKADPCIRDESGNSCFDYTDDKAILQLLEPFKVNLVENIKKQDSFEDLIKRLVATGEAEEKEFKSCSTDEINTLEREHDVILPEEYKKFLRVMGKGAGTFLTSDHWDAFLPSFDDFLGKKYFEYEDDDLAEVEELLVQPENFFIFASRLGDSNLGFFADGSSDNPLIYRFDDEGEIEKAYESFWGFIQEMVEYYEFFRDPSKFSQRNIEQNNTRVEGNKWWMFWK